MGPSATFVLLAALSPAWSGKVPSEETTMIQATRSRRSMAEPRALDSSWVQLTSWLDAAPQTGHGAIADARSCRTYPVRALANKFDNRTDALLLFASPKTGSSTLLHAFNLNYGGQASPNFDGKCYDEYGKLFTCESMGKNMKTHHRAVAADFMTRYSKEDSTTFVIAPFRHVLGRSISEFFQTEQMLAEECEANPAKRADCGKVAFLRQSADRLLNKFWEKWQKTGTYGRAYLSEYRKAIGVNLEDYASDGSLMLRTICPGNRTTFSVLLRAEDSANWKHMLLRAFPASSFELDKAWGNTAEDKWYAEKYTEFKKAFAAGTTEEERREMGASCEQSFFYGPETIADQIRRR